MKIRISNVSEDDFGLWRCLAKNSQGETSGEIKLYGMSMYDTSNYEAIAPAPLDHLQFTLEERTRSGPNRPAAGHLEGEVFFGLADMAFFGLSSLFRP